MEIWKEKKIDPDILKWNQVAEQVDQFFEQLQENSVLTYREGQHTMALDVMDAIKNREILLIEAGVGIGKSFAYLVPLLYSKWGGVENFRKILISTSSIALQEQLKGDIQKISEILGLPPIRVSIAKGKNNFICKKKVQELLDGKNSQGVSSLIGAIESSQTGDRLDFEEIPERTWKLIRATNCNFQKCTFHKDCPFIKSRQEFSEGDLVICNHDLLIENLKRPEDEKLLSSPNALVIDEAHSFEDKVRTAYKKTIYRKELEFALSIALNEIGENNPVVLERVETTVRQLYNKISHNAKSTLKKNSSGEYNVVDCDRLEFRVTSTIDESIDEVLTLIKSTIQLSEVYEKTHSLVLKDGILSTLKEYQMMFQDMKCGSNSKNNYWVEFYDWEGKYINLVYAPKKIEEITSKLLSNKKYPTIFTSATMDVNDNYGHFCESVGLGSVLGTPITKEYPQRSPFNYKDHALLYLANDLVSPKSREQYLVEVTKRIEELLRITEGKSLVLFTSKADMNYVYEHMERVQFDFPIYHQIEGGCQSNIKKRFETEVNSSLFATGVFWEGINVQGPALSSVIIPKLPFPIVEPIIKDKASKYKDGFGEVYLKEMIIKLKQGAGRLIRTEEDCGVLSILDSRIFQYEKEYNGVVLSNLPFATRTSSLEDVKTFANEKQIIKVKK